MGGGIGGHHQAEADGAGRGGGADEHGAPADPDHGLVPDVPGGVARGLRWATLLHICSFHRRAVRRGGDPSWQE
jgi:hypothetical protein